MQFIKLMHYLLMLVRNIIFQGIFYMSIGEKLYKILLTVVFFLILNTFIDNKIFSFLLAHLLNYLLNGQFYVVHRYLDRDNEMNMEKLEEYFSFIEKTIIKFNPLDVLIIGGFSRGVIKKTSDLDLRIYHDKTFISSLNAYLMATYLRFHGLKKKFPIDVFCFSSMSFLEKIRDDEIPVNFKKDKQVLKKYPLSKSYKDQLQYISFI